MHQVQQVIRHNIERNFDSSSLFGNAAPYLGRMNDNGKNGIEECERMQSLANGMGSNTRILVASIRDVKSMGDLICKGMDTFTFNPDIARELFKEQLTISAAEEFEAAAARTGGSK